MTMQQLETNGASSNPIPGADDTSEVDEAVRMCDIADALVSDGATIGAFQIPAFSTSAGFSIEQWLSQAIGTAFPLFLAPPAVAIGYICDAVRLQGTHALEERETALVRCFELQQCGRTLSKAENEEIITLQRVVKNAAGAFEKEHGDANKKALRDSFWNHEMETPAQIEFHALLERYLLDESDYVQRGFQELASMLLETLQVPAGEYLQISNSGMNLLDKPNATIGYGKTPQPISPFGGLANGVMFFQCISSQARHSWNSDATSGRDAIAAWCGADSGDYHNTQRPNLMQSMKRRIKDAMIELGLPECEAVWNGQREDTSQYGSDAYAAIRIQYREKEAQTRNYLSKWLYCGTKDTAYSLVNVFK